MAATPRAVPCGEGAPPALAPVCVQTFHGTWPLADTFSQIWGPKRWPCLWGAPDIRPSCPHGTTLASRSPGLCGHALFIQVRSGGAHSGSTPRQPRRLGCFPVRMLHPWWRLVLLLTHHPLPCTSPLRPSDTPHPPSALSCLEQRPTAPGSAFRPGGPWSSAPLPQASLIPGPPSAIAESPRLASLLDIRK